MSALQVVFRPFQASGCLPVKLHPRCVFTWFSVMSWHSPLEGLLGDLTLKRTRLPLHCLKHNVVQQPSEKLRLTPTSFGLQIIMVVNSVFLASLGFLTLPLYSICVQMGGDSKAQLLSAEIVQNASHAPSLKVTALFLCYGIGQFSSPCEGGPYIRHAYILPDFEVRYIFWPGIELRGRYVHTVYWWRTYFIAYASRYSRFCSQCLCGAFSASQS